MKKWMNSIQIKNVKDLLIFDDMVFGIVSDKKLQPLLTELFIGGRKLCISLILVTQLYFAVPKNIALSSTHYFSIKTLNKEELEQTTQLIKHQILTLNTL